MSHYLLDSFQLPVAFLATFVLNEVKGNKNMQKISVVFILDNSFAMQTATSITSLLKNKNKNTFYDIYLIVNQVSDANLHRIKKQQSQNCQIIIKQADMKKFQNLHHYRQGGYLSATESALLKFDLPQILKHLDKVLYLDGDVIIRSDLSPLFDIDIENYYLAAAHDTGKLYIENEFFRKYSDYFNSGVMLLNLKKLRQDNITETLIETKKNLNDQNLMDQNVLNVVLSSHVKLVDSRWNFLALNLYRSQKKWKIEDLNRLCKTQYKSLKDLTKQAVIIHFSSREKPWKYPSSFLADEWLKYYKKSPYKHEKLVFAEDYQKNNFWEKLFSVKNGKRHKLVTILGLSIKIKSKKLIYREKIKTLEQSFQSVEKLIKFLSLKSINKEKILSEIEKFDTYGLCHEKRSPKLIVSLTSYPDRMYDIHFCLYSLLRQKTKPDAVILWLAESQFARKEKDIPQKVLKLCEQGLTIKWCKEDMKSYKKLVPALKEYPNDIIVTADDDLYYQPDWLEKLYEEYLSDSVKTVVAHRCHQILLQAGNVLPYSQWSKCIVNTKPSPFNFATSGGGVLYPPHCLHSDIFNQELFMSLAPKADDIWFWAMGVLNGQCCRTVFAPNEITFVNPKREAGMNDDGRLYQTNGKGGNDEQLKQVLDYYPELLKILVNHV